MPRKLSLPHPVYLKIKEFLIPYLNECNIINRAKEGCKDDGCNNLQKILKKDTEKFNGTALDNILKIISHIYLWFLSKTIVQYCLPDAYIVMEYFDKKESGITQMCCKSYESYKNNLIEKGSVPDLYKNSDTEGNHKSAFNKLKQSLRNNDEAGISNNIYEIACLYNIKSFNISVEQYIDTANHLRKMIAIASNSVYDNFIKKYNETDRELVEWIRKETSQEYLIPSEWKLEGGKFISNFDSRIKYLGSGYLDPVNMFNQIKGLFIRWIINYYASDINIDYSYISNPSYTSYYSKTNSFHVCKVCSKVFIGKSTSEYCGNACRQRISRKINRF